MTMSASVLEALEKTKAFGEAHKNVYGPSGETTGAAPQPQKDPDAFLDKNKSAVQAMSAEAQAQNDSKPQQDASHYSGVDDYGNWNKEWQDNVKQQQLYASGSFDPDSEFAKQFEGLKEDGKSRVDDEEGWRELAFDKPPKSAGDYRDLVEDWSEAGFDVRAIDMDDGFAHSNIAVRKSAGGGGGDGDGTNPYPDGYPNPNPDSGSGSGDEPGGAGSGGGSGTGSSGGIQSPRYEKAKYQTGYGNGGGGGTYASDNPGYYYGTAQAKRDLDRANMISDNAATAVAKGLSDIGTWQEGAQQTSQYHNNILHEIYKSMGLIPSRG